jgi:hypothetical protein
MRTLVTIIIASLPLVVAAQPSAAELTAEVTDNVSTEYVECAAYFAVVQDAFSKSGNAAASAKYNEVSDKAAQFGLMAAQQSRSEEMATKVTLSRFETNLKSMQKTIENNYSNIALLSSKYSDSCVEAMTDSTVMIKRWTTKITSKYEKAEQK